MPADDDNTVRNDSEALRVAGGFLRVLLCAAPERVAKGGQLLRIRFMRLEGGE